MPPWGDFCSLGRRGLTPILTPIFKQKSLDISQKFQTGKIPRKQKTACKPLKYVVYRLFVMELET